MSNPHTESRELLLVTALVQKDKVMNDARHEILDIRRRIGSKEVMGGRERSCLLNRECELYEVIAARLRPPYRYRPELWA